MKSEEIFLPQGNIWKKEQTELHEGEPRPVKLRHVLLEMALDIYGKRKLLYIIFRVHPGGYLSQTNIL